MNILEKLNEETNNLTANAEGATLNTKAHTVSLYKAVTNLIFTDLVNVSETKTRVANVYCWEHVDKNDNIIVNTPATYSGKFGVAEREYLTDKGLEFPTKTDYKEGDYFLDVDTDVVYQSVKDNPFDGNTVPENEDKINLALCEGSIRYVSDTSPRDGFAPVDSSFKMRAWRGDVGTRRTRLDITTEALQDLGNVLGEDAEQKAIDSIAMVISDDINKDIIHKLQCVSKRYKTEKFDNKVVIDFSKDKRDGYLIGRELYSIITDMVAQVTTDTKFTPNFVVTSPRVAGLINTSGMSVADSPTKKKNVQDRYILNDGTTMYVDVTAKFDYIIVGVKNDNASSLYLSNFVQTVTFSDTVGDGGTKGNVGTYGIFKAVNTDSLSESFMCLSRYALTSPPYTYDDEENDGSRIVQGDRWEKLAGKSPLSMMVGFKLPKLEK